MSLNPKQFQQPHLFDPATVPVKQPHQMQPLEFANHPDTFWHASQDDDFEALRSQTEQFADHQGFHVGSPHAALDRRSASYLHPLRINDDVRREMGPPEAAEWSARGSAHPQQGRVVRDQGDNWDESHHRAWYVNEYEDQGSVSAILKSTDDVTHYADYVHDALDRGGIPSGAAEHWATQMDSEHRQYSPGFKRTDLKIKRDQRGDASIGPREEPNFRLRDQQGIQGRMVAHIATNKGEFAIPPDDAFLQYRRDYELRPDL